MIWEEILMFSPDFHSISVRTSIQTLGLLTGKLLVAIEIIAEK